MIYQNHNFYIITGEPGVGRTSVLNQLFAMGYDTIAEDARRIIKEQTQNQSEGLPWKDKDLYTSLMIKTSLETFKKTAYLPKRITFFDRGIPDAFCYANMNSLVSSEDIRDISNHYKYNPRVFILPP